MASPKVSIIVPNYNYGRYLDERLGSILGQTFGDFELILLDDCSTDHSRDVLTRYAGSDGRVTHLLVNERNSGSPFAQWTKGIQLAQGKYIWIAEADDSADPRFLECLVGYLDASPQAVVAMSASVMTDGNGQPIPKDYDHWSRRKHLQGREATCYPGLDFVRHNMYWRNWIYNASGVVFRRETVHDEALSALGMRYSGDWLFWCHIAMQGEVVEVHERLNRFRFHGGSVTRRAAYQGSLEDVHIVGVLNSRLTVPACKRRVRAGRFYRRTGKLGLAPGQQRDVERHIRAAFGVGKTVALALDALSKFLPFIPCEASDNHHGTPISHSKHP